jgi:hypothetical protein
MLSNRAARSFVKASTDIVVAIPDEILQQIDVA